MADTQKIEHPKDNEPIGLDALSAIQQYFGSPSSKAHPTSDSQMTGEMTGKKIDEKEIRSEIAPALGISFFKVAIFILSLSFLLVSTNQARACGVERWPVKTLQDVLFLDLNQETTITTSVEDLVTRFKAHSKKQLLAMNSSRFPEEKVSYEVSGQILGFKLEADGDLHIVIADTDNRAVTMIVEVPDPTCIPQSNISLILALSEVRTAFVSKLGNPSAKYKVLPHPVKATFTGKGFFDFNHKQTGVAKNAFELHPVYNIEF